MAEVYTFRVRLCELKNVIWRDIEITSVSSVAKLGYAIHKTVNRKGLLFFVACRIAYFSWEKFFYKSISNDLNISICPVIIKIQNRMSRRILCESMSGDVFG